MWLPSNACPVHGRCASTVSLACFSLFLGAYRQAVADMQNAQQGQRKAKTGAAAKVTLRSADPVLGTDEVQGLHLNL